MSTLFGSGPSQDIGLVICCSTPEKDNTANCDAVGVHAADVDKQVHRICVTVNAPPHILAIIMQVSEINPLMDAKSLAGYLKVSTRTLENLIGRGEGPPFLRLGRQRRWRAVDVEDWLQAQAETARSCESR